MTRKLSVVVFVFLCSPFLLPLVVHGIETATPFGFKIGDMPYEDVLKVLEERGWKYEEFEKKQFKRIGTNDPRKGKDTFIIIKSPGLDGVKNLLLFLSQESNLDAVIVSLDPDLFDSILAEMSQKYTLLAKHLSGEDLSNPYPHAQWEAGKTVIELQKNSPHRVRLVYVPKLLYENYKDFLEKRYEGFKTKLKTRKWMDEL